MHRRIVVLAMATVLSLSAASSLHAAPLGFHHAAADKQATGKMVHFNVRNDSRQVLTLQAGEQQFTVAAGKTMSVKLAEGTEVITVNGTSKAAPGSVLATVSAMLQNNTLAVS